MTVPATAVKLPPAPSRLNGLTKRQRLLLEYQQHVNERAPILARWRDLNRYLFTSRGRFLTTEINKANWSKDSLDITAILAARTCAAGIQTGTTNAARPWYRLTTPDPDLAEYAPVKRWLDLVRQRMDGVLIGSNFYKSTHTLYGDMAGFGTSPMLIEEDERSVIRCHSFPVGSYVIGTDAAGRVNYFGREFQMTVRQLVEEFGYEQCSPTVRNQWDTGGTQLWIRVYHVIYTNPNYNPRYLDSKFKRFASCTFEAATPQDEDRFLRERGYDRFPVVCGRWETTAEDAYGTDCPGMIALPDIKMLQQMEKRGLQAIDKSVMPPLVGHPDLRNEPVSQLPGGITYDERDSKSGLRPLFEVDPRLDKLEAKEVTGRDRIDRAFYVDLFRAIAYLDDTRASSQPVTAAEIAERKEEKLMQLGPMLHNLDDDVYTPALDRVFGIMLLRGLIPPAPPELQGTDLKIEYISIMHAAQKAAGIGGLERFAGFAANMAKTTNDPSVMDRVNMDELIEEHADLGGVASKVVRSDDEVAAIRQNRAQRQQAAERAQNAQLNAGAVKDLADARAAEPAGAAA